MAEETDSPTTGTEKERKILTDLRARFKKALDADNTQRRDALEDMRFATVPGYQWDSNQKKERGNRPCYEFNKIRVTGKRIINNMRDNRPAGKVRGTEDNDVDTAEVYEGLIRNIWAKNGDNVMDYAAEYQVFGGYGAWRLDTVEPDNDPFNQEILTKTIYNPFCLFADPSSRDVLKRDSRYWIFTEKLPNDEFEEKYKDKPTIDFESHEFDDEEDWQDDEETRIAEYWYMEPVTKEIWKLMDGRVIDSESKGAAVIPDEQIEERKTIDTHKIMMCIASGEAILEGPTEWAGTMFPFVPVYGEYYIIDGRTYWNGVTRFSKDAQRSYNTSRTAITETIAMAPQSKFWATATQAEGHTAKWKVAHQKNMPFMLYNPDPLSPGPPTRMGGADIPTALIQESQLAAEEINMVTGIYQGDIGAPNQATSGRQEIARQQAGAIATFNYSDNMAKAIERTWELLIDLIPKIYTTKRSLRVLGQDGAEKYVTIFDVQPDPQTGEPVTVHDLSVGQYDTTVTVGPNFSTKRQEAADTYQQLLQGNPDLFPIIGDLVFKATDLPYAEEISERMQIMLPPEIRQSMDEGKDMPPEVMQMMQQAQQAMQMVEQQMAQVQEAGAQVKLEATENEQAKAEIEKLLADLDKKQAQFEAKIAKDLAGVAQKEAKFTMDSLNHDSGEIIEQARSAAEQNTSQFQQALAQDTMAVLEEINTVVAALNEHAAKTVGEVANAISSKPRIKKITSKRVGGKIEAVPEYDDDDRPKIARITREIGPDGEMQVVPVYEDETQH